eukprot:TRINITY_DN4165_c0_g1_i1.p1 TRINITY_DN4165_c0_g1~~TRINITY_DN4165_c0_g1_i1.p1  ORF type:complete len:554 (+),score=170.85 TRINITY_DN4165_c0_g1_i1:98-1759(+)
MALDVRRFSGTLVLEFDELTVAVDAPVATGADGRVEDTTGAVPWAEVDLLLVSHVKGFRGVPYATEHHGYRGPVMASDPVYDAGRWELQGLVSVARPGRPAEACYAQADVDACLPRVQRVEAHRSIDLGGWYVLPLPSDGCVGGMAWLIYTPGGDTILVANAGLPRDAASGIGTVDVVVAMELAGAGTPGQDYAQTLQAVLHAVEGRQRHVVIPANMEGDPFAALGLCKYLAENATIPCVLVSAMKDVLQEFGGRTYEFLPPAEQGRLQLPNRPFCNHGGAALSALTPTEFRQPGHASRPAAFVFADPGALPRLLADLQDRVAQKTTFALGVTVLLPPGGDDVGVRGACSGAEIATAPYGSRLTAARLMDFITAVAPSAVVVNDEAAAAACGGSARVVPVPRDGAASVAPAAAAEPGAKRRKGLEGHVVLDATPGARTGRNRVVDGKMVWALGPVSVSAQDGQLALRPPATYIPSALYGTLTPEALKANLEERGVSTQGVVVQRRGPDSWEAAVPALKAKVVSEGARTAVTFGGTAAELTELDKTLELSLFAM